MIVRCRFCGSGFSGDAAGVDAAKASRLKSIPPKRPSGHAQRANVGDIFRRVFPWHD